MMNEEDEEFNRIEREAAMRQATNQPVQPQQEPSETRSCRSCNGTGDRDTGIAESPTSICKPCKGTGRIALAQPEQPSFPPPTESQDHD